MAQPLDEAERIIRAGAGVGKQQLTGEARGSGKVNAALVRPDGNQEQLGATGGQAGKHIAPQLDCQLPAQGSSK